MPDTLAAKLLKIRQNLHLSQEEVADELKFKDVFRYSSKHGLISEENSELWLKYRDNRNDTAHNYGKSFAKQT